MHLQKISIHVPTGGVGGGGGGQGLQRPGVLKKSVRLTWNSERVGDLQL